MIVKTGCDLVEIKKFKNSVQRGGEQFLNKLFSEQELVNSSSVFSLAGIFAAKEAIIKALQLKAGQWRKIEIIKTQRHRPEAYLEQDILEKIDQGQTLAERDLTPYKILSQDISISHDGNYAMAIAIFVIDKKK